MIDLTTIEENLRAYRYKPPGAVDEAIEYSLLPSFQTAYKQLCRLLRNRIPKQEELVSYLDPKNEAEANRIRRAYPSLIRDHHLYLLLQKAFRLVIRTDELDEAGVDFIIIEGRYGFCIHAFVDTPQAWAWRRQKDERHPNLPGYHIDLPLSLDNSRHCGQFRLYGDKDIRQLKHKMHQLSHQQTAMTKQSLQANNAKVISPKKQ